MTIFSDVPRDLFKEFESIFMCILSFIIGLFPTLLLFFKLKNPILKSSEEWSNIHKEKVQILDPDGWDRTGDFDKSWNERISEDEFFMRVCNSTCQWTSEFIDEITKRAENEILYKKAKANIKR